LNASLGTLVVHAAPPTAHVIATGEFDLATFPAVSTQLSHALGSGCRDFHLDLARVTFLDATTLSVLVRLQRDVDELGGELTIVSPAPCVRTIFRLAGLSRLLDRTTPHELARQA
jgi:anti-anti-sigma factor